MDETSTDRLASVAERAARAGGDYLAAAFRGGPAAGEYTADDVKAVADRESERRVRAVIADAYPAHAIHAEEAGRIDGEGYEWVVDPLDGTNNFASGLPMFATAVAVRRGDETLVAAIYEPITDTLYRARRGGSATANGEPLTAGSDLPLDRGTVSLAVGLSAVQDPALSRVARRIETALRDRCRRVLQTWAPCVDWGLLARGGIEGIVCFHPDPFEQHAGELLAAEAGVAACRTPTTYVGAGDEATMATLRDVVDGAIDAA